MVEWGRLLSGYWGEILSRRFESCPPRHNKHVREGVFCFQSLVPTGGCYSNPVLPVKTRLRNEVCFVLIAKAQSMPKKQKEDSLFQTQFHP